MDAVTVANPDPTSPDSNTEISLQELPPSDGVLDSTESTQSSTAQSKPVFYFGCGPWHPKWLQVLANAKFYTFILCFFVIVEGSITSGECYYQEERERISQGRHSGVCVWVCNMHCTYTTKKRNFVMTTCI